MQPPLFVGQQHLDAALGFIQSTRTEAHQLYSFLEDFQGLFERKFIAFELRDDFLKALQ
jgi:hypothetical protein